MTKRIEQVAALGADPARDEALSKTRAVLDFVKNDKSFGVHNPHLIKSMIEANLEALSRVSGQ